MGKKPMAAALAAVASSSSRSSGAGLDYAGTFAQQQSTQRAQERQTAALVKRQNSISSGDFLARLSVVENIVGPATPREKSVAPESSVASTVENEESSAVSVVDELSRGSVIEWPLKRQATRVFELMDTDREGLVALDDFPAVFALMRALEPRGTYARTGAIITLEGWLDTMKNLFDDDDDDDVAKTLTQMAAELAPRSKNLQVAPTRPKPALAPALAPAPARAMSASSPIMRRAMSAPAAKPLVAASGAADGGGDFKLKDEAEYVFTLGDKDGNGKLDGTEVTALLQKSMVLRAAIDVMGTNGDDLVGRQQWLTYIKTQSEKNAVATKKLLRAYAKHLGATIDFDEVMRQREQAEEERRCAENELELKHQQHLRRLSEISHLSPPAERSKSMK